MLAAFGVLLLFLPAQLGALVELKVPSDCDAAFADFQARVSASVVGMPSSNRRAGVVIDRRGARYRLEIRTQGDAASRTKRLSTASCEEAAAAATAVLALALSEPAAATTESVAASSESATTSTESAATDAKPATASTAPGGLSSELARASGVSAAASSKPATESREAAAAGGELAASSNGREAASQSVRRRARPGSVDSAARIDRDEPSAGSRPVRLSLRAGIDTGTLASATGYVGALAAIPAGPFEWRALVAYGLPSVDERIDPGISELRREQFLLVDLGGCYGFGVRVWLAACAAGELNVVQRARALDDVSDDRTGVRLAGVLAAHIAYRGSRLQPEFELGAAAAALGAGDTGPLALRASFGLGLQF